MTQHNPNWPADKFTYSQFLESYHELRRLMGQRDFWTKDESVRQSALDAFGFVFLNVFQPDASNPNGYSTLDSAKNKEMAAHYYNLIDAWRGHAQARRHWPEQYA